MYTQVLHQLSLSPEELDSFLAKGWYRVGQSLVTTNFMVSNKALRSVVWTRVQLAGFQFRSGLRKLMRQVERQYQVTIGPMVLDAEHQALYEQYLCIAKGERSATLQEVMFDDSDRNLFETREIQVRQNGRLIAFSWFDLGTTSIQSDIAVYDPEYSKASLGFYTLLREIQFGIESGFEFHYSGYALPGDPSMDYKLRSGGIWFLDPRTRQWHPWVALQRQKLPAERLFGALYAVRHSMERLGKLPSIFVYRAFGVLHDGEPVPNRLKDPLFLSITTSLSREPTLIVTFHFERQRFELKSVSLVERPFIDSDGRILVSFWVQIQEHHGEFTTPFDVANAMVRQLEAPMTAKTLL